MTRSDLVEELAARFAQLTHRDAEYAVKTILDAMSDALVRGHRIEIRGFGSFSVNRRPPRIGRNPRSVGAMPCLHDGKLTVVRLTSTREIPMQVPSSPGASAGGNFWPGSLQHECR